MFDEVQENTESERFENESAEWEAIARDEFEERIRMSGLDIKQEMRKAA